MVEQALFRALLIFVTFLFPSVAFAVDWNTAISNVEKRYSFLLNQDRETLGSMFYFDVDAISCSILARMLGEREAAVQLEKSTDYWRDENDIRMRNALELRFLDHWIGSAKFWKELDDSRRIREWNTVCAGNFGYSRIPEPTESTFYDVDGEFLRVLGPVEMGFHSKIKSALDAHPEVKVVALGSGGGAVMEGIAAGRLIRERGLSTTLWSDCMSACTLVFLGGVDRDIWQRPTLSRLGFHEVSRNGQAVPRGDEIYDVIADYYQEMGLDREIYQLYFLAPPQSMFFPDEAMLCDLRVATWIQRYCFVE